MEATVSHLLMLQKHIISKQKSLKLKIMHCVKVIFLKIIQLIVWKIQD